MFDVNWNYRRKSPGAQVVTKAEKAQLRVELPNTGARGQCLLFTRNRVLFHAIRKINPLFAKYWLRSVVGWHFNFQTNEAWCLISRLELDIKQKIGVENKGVTRAKFSNMRYEPSKPQRRNLVRVVDNLPLREEALLSQIE